VGGAGTPQVAEEFVQFSYKLTTPAFKALQTLPQELQAALWAIIQSLTANPIQPPNTSGPIDQHGRILLYRQQKPALEITYEIDNDKEVLVFMHFTSSSIGVAAKRLIVSYSANDMPIWTSLRRFLKPLEVKSLISVWDVTEIAPGANRKQAIQQELDAADMALLLVSQDYLNGDYNDQELALAELLGLAKGKGLALLWIAVGASTVSDTPIAAYQALHDPGTLLNKLAAADLDSELLKIYGKLKELI
jgi:hypothetical protein